MEKSKLAINKDSISFYKENYVPYGTKENFCEFILVKVLLKLGVKISDDKSYEYKFSKDFAYNYKYCTYKGIELGLNNSPNILEVKDYNHLYDGKKWTRWEDKTFLEKLQFKNLFNKIAKEFIQLGYVVKDRREKTFFIPVEQKMIEEYNSWDFFPGENRHGFMHKGFAISELDGTEMNNCEKGFIQSTDRFNKPLFNGDFKYGYDCWWGNLIRGKCYDEFNGQVMMILNKWKYAKIDKSDLFDLNDMPIHPQKNRRKILPLNYIEKNYDKNSIELMITKWFKGHRSLKTLQDRFKAYAIVNGIKVKLYNDDGVETKVYLDTKSFNIVCRKYNYIIVYDGTNKRLFEIDNSKVINYEKDNLRELYAKHKEWFDLMFKDKRGK